MKKFETILDQRRAGILLHITSLPGKYENGDMGKDAYNFIDFLKNTGISVWQTLPLGMPHADGSPYQCLSANAGNPALISIDWLIEKGWLAAADLADEKHSGPAFRASCLRSAFKNFQQCAAQQDVTDYDRFCHENSWWLDDFSMFIALIKEFDQAGWVEWPTHFKNREKAALEDVAKLFSNALDRTKFTQYVFFRQWQELREYANQQGVYLFGDIPIFVAYDSADVWAKRENFKLDDSGELLFVTGVPPDYFSATGQLWGNPHYDWTYMQKNGFQWWLERIKIQLEMFDIIRIDHFRGLEAAWEVSADEETAINGQWVPAPGDALLAKLKEEFASIPLVAEDLGVITPLVEELRDKYALPGMKILQFAYDGSTDNPYLPHNHINNSVVYTGTHDNDTTLGWYNTLENHEKKHIQECLGNPQLPMPYALIHTALASVANLAIIPMQDVLRLGSEHRMNIPGTIEGNWQWRFSWEQLLKEDNANELKHLINLFGRKPA